MVKALGTNAKSSWVTFAMFWMTTGPRQDNRRRFGCGRVARSRQEPWDETIPALVVYVPREFDVWPNGGRPDLSDSECQLNVSIGFVVLIFGVKVGH